MRSTVRLFAIAVLAVGGSAGLATTASAEVCQPGVITPGCPQGSLVNPVGTPTVSVTPVCAGGASNELAYRAEAPGSSVVTISYPGADGASVVLADQPLTGSLKVGAALGSSNAASLPITFTAGTKAATVSATRAQITAACSAAAPVSRTRSGGVSAGGVSAGGAAARNLPAALSSTGAEAGMAVGGAALLIGLGAGAVAVSRRRSSASV